MAIRRLRRPIKFVIVLIVLIIVFELWTPPNFEEREKIILNDTVLTADTLRNLKTLLKCHDRGFEPSFQQRQEYWVLYNFVRAGHGQIGCHEAVTFAAHGDFSFMDNLLPVVERWMNPVSFSLHAPGDDFDSTVSSIRYARDCSGSDLVKQYVTFHVFFPYWHRPRLIPDMAVLLNEPYDCSQPPPYMVESNQTYRSLHNIVFPINLARNVAREPALTHFHLVTDIELYPSAYIPERFLNMIARNEPPLNRTSPRVFPLSIFEVEENYTAPTTKAELVSMLTFKTAIPFHKKICSKCHAVPQAKEWMLHRSRPTMEVFHIAKRKGKFYTWEPIYIGTAADPIYDERLSWDGKRDKMPQGYAMCALDYDFMILSDAFIVHRPGIKNFVRKGTRSRQTNIIIKNHIVPELKLLYGDHKDCKV